MVCIQFCYSKFGRDSWLADWAEMRGARPTKEEKAFFFLFSNTQPSNSHFEQVEAFSRLDPKIKVALKIVIFNFAKRSKVKILIDFEI
jgi:hypothetical protein